MTSSNDRLDQIALLLQQSIIAGNERMTRIEQSMERDRQESSARMTRIEKAQAVTQAQVDGLVQIIAEFSTRNEERLNMLDDAIADISKSIVGINATNKNLQRILAQLIRRNRDSSEDKPQP